MVQYMVSPTRAVVTTAPLGLVNLRADDMVKDGVMVSWVVTNNLE